MAEPAGPSPSVVMHFPNMAPVLHLPPGSAAPVGVVADRIRELARKAGVEIGWHGPEPRARILAELGAGVPACTPNVVRTPDRARDFQFSEPIFPARHWSVVARPGQPWINSYRTFSELLADPARLMGHLHGASLGTGLDRMILDNAPRVQNFQGSPAMLLKAVSAGRVDYALADLDGPGEIEPLLQEAGLPPGSLIVLPFSDIPPQDPGRIMCSPLTPKTILEAFNRAIRDGGG